MTRVYCLCLQDVKNKDVEDVIILSGDHLYRMDYLKFVQVCSSPACFSSFSILLYKKHLHEIIYKSCLVLRIIHCVMIL